MLVDEEREKGQPKFNNETQIIKTHKIHHQEHLIRIKSKLGVQVIIIEKDCYCESRSRYLNCIKSQKKL